MTNQVNLFFASLSLFAAMSVAYVFSVSPMFSSDSFFPLPLHLSGSRVTFLALATSGLVALLNLRKKFLADVFSLIAIVFFTLPVVVVAAMDSFRPIAWVAICFIAVLPAHFVPKLVLGRKVSLGNLNSSFVQRITNVALVILLIGFVGLTLSVGALHRINFNLGDIYLYREEQATALGGGLTAYLSIWVPRVILPYLLIVSIFRKQIIAIIGLSLLTLYFFGIMNDRQVLFIPVLAAFFYVFLRSHLEIHSILWLLSLIILGITLAVNFELIPDEFTTIGLRRTFFIPAAASFSWYQFFSVNDLVTWSDKFGFLFGTTQYSSESLPRLMGFEIRDDRVWNANAGLAATGFANLGVTGVLVYSVLLGLLIKLYVLLGRELAPNWLIVALAANPVRTAWADTDLLTALTSHGLLLVFIILLLVSAKTWEERK